MTKRCDVCGYWYSDLSDDNLCKVCLKPLLTTKIRQFLKAFHKKHKDVANRPTDTETGNPMTLFTLMKKENFTFWSLLYDDE